LGPLVLLGWSLLEAVLFVVYSTRHYVPRCAYVRCTHITCSCSIRSAHVHYVPSFATLILLLYSYCVLDMFLVHKCTRLVMFLVHKCTRLVMSSSMHSSTRYRSSYSILIATLIYLVCLPKTDLTDLNVS
jgi:dolichol kinase